MRTSKRGLEVGGEEGGEAWKEGDTWPPVQLVQSDSEGDKEAEEEAKPSWHICNICFEIVLKFEWRGSHFGFLVSMSYSSQLLFDFCVVVVGRVPNSSWGCS
jgi:hypothetical protein